MSSQPNFNVSFKVLGFKNTRYLSDNNFSKIYIYITLFFISPIYFVLRRIRLRKLIDRLYYPTYLVLLSHLTVSSVTLNRIDLKKRSLRSAAELSKQKLKTEI
jgi:branched-subunit amino acid permease